MTRKKATKVAPLDRMFASLEGKPAPENIVTIEVSTDPPGTVEREWKALGVAPKKPRKSRAKVDPSTGLTPKGKRPPTRREPPFEYKDAAPLPAPVDPELPGEAMPLVQEQPKLAPEVKHTREEWLEKMADEMRPIFEKHGKPLPDKIRFSCGWPSTRAMGEKNRAIGQCWPPEASADKTTEIFISPAIGDVVECVGVLAHELVHAAVGCAAGHRSEFRAMAHKVGLEGKMTATTVGEPLRDWIQEAVNRIGPYPHAKLDMSQKKKQPTRLLKVICPSLECPYILETEGKRVYTVRMVESVFDCGAPKCGACGKKMEIEEVKTDGRKRKFAVKDPDESDEEE